MKKGMDNHREKPFEFLRRKGSNEFFPQEVVDNWYMARYYVLNEFKEKKIAFGPGSDGHLHAVVVGDSPLMLAIVRQLALSSHFSNFVEYDPSGHLLCQNRSVITLVSDKEADEILRELEKEEYLCNLPKYCKLSVCDSTRNEDSFIDIELEIRKDDPGDAAGLRITEEMVRGFIASQKPDEVFSIDTRKAVFASRAYGIGSYIGNIPYESIFSSERYSHALNKLKYRLLKPGKGLVSDPWKESLTSVKENLSNLFCSDCFETRKMEIDKLLGDGRKKKETEVWKSANQELSLSEHSRWVVEKLVLGYRPWTDRERKEYETLFGNAKKGFVKRLKANPADPSHIDLCSYRDIRRIDPDNLKYDAFLVLAIPLILKKIQGK